MPTSASHLSVVESTPLDHAKAHLVETVDDAMELLRWLSTKTKIGFDTETTGLNHDTDRARLVQVGDAKDGWAIPFERWAGVVDDLVRRYQGEYVMHNAPYDWIMMQNGGINLPIHKIHDTRLMAHVLHSTGSLALKTLAQRYVDPRSGAAQAALNDGIGNHGGWTWETVPVTYEPYWVYGALDPVLTFLLDEQLRPRVEAEAPLSYQLELQVNWICERMARKGAHIDRAYTTTFADKMAQHLAAVEQWCTENYAVKPGSDLAIIEILQRDGAQFTKFTDGGRPSIDKNVLGPMAERGSALYHPLAEAVLGRRQAQKILNTYLRTYLELSERDGRIHPSINSVGGTAKSPFESGGTRGVRTGRMSMDEPNLQNVPIHTNQGKKIRNCFDVEDDYSWVKCDADQIEMRIFAHLANDPALLAAFDLDRNGGVDVFTANARDIFQEADLVKDDLRRQHVKNAWYAKLYGAGVEQFAKTAGIRTIAGELDLPVAQAFLTRLDQMYPGVRALQRQIETTAFSRREAEGEAYVYSPLTHRRHVADSGREYALMNYMIQGAAGEVLKMKMVELDHAGLGKYMMLPVHDEIDFEIPDDEVDDALATIHDVVDDATLLSVPLTWTTEVGKRWGECS